MTAQIIQHPNCFDRMIGAISVAQAVEAFTKHTTLTPLARLLGIELVSRFNVRTLKCFPSEKYLAKALGVTDRAIRKAKAELKQARLIDWRKPKRHQSCEYVISWRRLKEWLEHFREEWKAELGTDDTGLIQLHNEFNRSETDDSLPEQTGNNTGTVVPDDRNCGSALLSQSKSQSKSPSVSTHLRAVGDDLERSPPAQIERGTVHECSEPQEPEPQAPHEPIGSNGSGDDQRALPPPEQEILKQAAERLFMLLSPKIARSLTRELAEEAVRECARYGFRAAFELIIKHRRRAA